MRDALTIGHLDLRLFLRNRALFVWLFGMPLAFVYFMGFANRGPGDPRNARPPVLVENHDEGFLSREFLQELGVQGLNVVSPTNAAQAKRGVRVPSDFTAEILAGRQAKVRFFTVDNSEDASSVLIQMRLARALIAINSHLLEQATGAGGQPPTAESIAALRKLANPVILEARFAGRKPIPSGFNLSLPGVLVMYLLMNLLTFGGTALATERRHGVLRRMMMHPIRRGSLIAGKIYGLMLLALVQILFLLAAGQWWFGVNLGDHLGGILLVLLVFSWNAASLGVLAGSVVRAEDKVVGLCVLSTLVMAALGGCWWPLELVPEGVQRLAHCFPTGWAMDALHQLISFGAGLGSVKLALGVLALFGAAANTAAVKFFRV